MSKKGTLLQIICILCCPMSWLIKEMCSDSFRILNIEYRIPKSEISGSIENLCLANIVHHEMSIEPFDMIMNMATWIHGNHGNVAGYRYTVHSTLHTLLWSMRHAARVFKMFALIVRWSGCCKNDNLIKQCYMVNLAMTPLPFLEYTYMYFVCIVRCLLYSLC